MNPPLTPGEILLEEYIKPMGISQNAMARAITRRSNEARPEPLFRAPDHTPKNLLKHIGFKLFIILKGVS